MRRMNLLTWVLGLFIAHALMYLMLGTDSWMATTLLATSVWGFVLFILKVVAKSVQQDEEEVH